MADVLNSKINPVLLINNYDFPMQAYTVSIAKKIPGYATSGSGLVG